MPDFIDTEHSVEKLFPVGTTFFFEGKEYKVLLCGKPRPSQGECKTDVYIKGIASDEGGNLAASKIRNLECPSYEICLIDYGCGKFNRKIHIMEQYP